MHYIQHPHCWIHWFDGLNTLTIFISASGCLLIWKAGKGGVIAGLWLRLASQLCCPTSLLQAPQTPSPFCQLCLPFRCWALALLKPMCFSVLCFPVPISVCCHLMLTVLFTIGYGYCHEVARLCCSFLVSSLLQPERRALSMPSLSFSCSLPPSFFSFEHSACAVSF